MNRFGAISALAFSVLLIVAVCSWAAQRRCVCQKDEPAAATEPQAQTRFVAPLRPLRSQEKAQSGLTLDDITTRLDRIAEQLALIQAGAEQLHADISASVKPKTTDRPPTAADEEKTQEQGRKQHQQGASAKADADKVCLAEQRRAVQSGGQVISKEIWDGQGFTPRRVVVVKEGEGRSSVWRYVPSPKAHTSTIDETILSILRVASTSQCPKSDQPATSAGENEAPAEDTDAQPNEAPEKPDTSIKAPPGFELTKELRQIEIGAKQIEEETLRIQQRIKQIAEHKLRIIQPAEVQKTAKQ